MFSDLDSVELEKLKVKSKIWIELDDEVVFGGGRTALLEANKEVDKLFLKYFDSF
ncbi:MAG: hypothetical protein SCK28_12345 [Bacillota bacterium]|nr:hypothetical protein [Bacillota bacterium]